jgi:Sec-independent protein translocase protein TatA
VSRIGRVLNLDPAKLLVIAAVAVILLGPDRLPQVARQVGAAWRSVTEVRHRMETEVRGSIPDLPSSSEIARLARSPSALLDHLSNLSPNADGTPVTPSTLLAGEPSNGVPRSYPSVPDAANQNASRPEASVPGDPGLN